MKIGIYGGSFDPIHNGHVRLAEYALRHTDMDEVWLMVSPLNPLKPQGYSASDSDRLAMAKIAVRDAEGVKASDFEFSLPRPSFTYATLSALRGAYSDVGFRLIIGGDNWAHFAEWKDPEKILEEFGVVVYPRPGEEIENLRKGVTVLGGAPLMDISSTEIRKALKYGDSCGKLKDWLSPGVLDYIRKKRLYL